MSIGSDQGYWLMPIKKISLAAVLAAAFAAPLPAHADLAGGMAALAEAQYDKALAELKPLAEAGDGEAQYQLGRIHENGWGVRASYQEAATWYHRAADRGHVPAMIRLAEFSLDGAAGPRNRREAYDWFMQAALKGDPRAMGLVGRWNLEGTAKRPDFLTAKKWLNKAAAAGDADSLALVEDLASKNFPILDIPGTDTPIELAAVRVMTEIKDLLEPMLQAPVGSTRLKLGQPPTVTKDGAGELVTLPLVEVVSAGGTWRLGTVQVLFTADGEDYAVDVRLPGISRLLAPDGHERGRLKIDSRKITGKWSTSLHTVTDYLADFSGLRYESAEGLPFTMTVRAVTGKRTYTPLGEGRYDVAELAEATDVATDGGVAAERRVMKLAGAAYTARYSGFDVPKLAQVAAQFGVDWRTRVLLSAAPRPADPPEPVPQLLAGLELGLKLRDLVNEDGDGHKVGGLAGAELTLSAADLDKAKGGVKIHYAHDGLAGSGETALLPASAEVTLSGHQVPVGDVVAAVIKWWRGGAGPSAGKPAGGMVINAALPLALPGAKDVPSLPHLNDAFAAAGAELRIEKADLTGDGYAVSVTGTITPGPSAKLDLSVKGLDKLTGSEPAPALAEDEVPAATVNPLELLTRAKVMAVDERGSKVFRIGIAADGKVTVNGKDASKVVGK
jgi:hypothetical protein